MKTYQTLVLCLFSTLLTFSLSGQVIITAVFDGPLPGGLPKGVELYVPEAIPDLSLLGIGSANNGGGSDSVEFSFPADQIEAGSYLYVSSDSDQFMAFFGFSPDYVTAGNPDAMAINGDDAIELFWDGNVIDIYGDINVDGSGTFWEYLDGWAARKPGTGPDGNTFAGENWNYSGPDALDNASTNATALSPVPIMTYAGTVDPDATVIMQNLLFIPADLTIEAGQTVRFTNVEEFVEHNVNGQQSVYPCNPQSFFSGPAQFGPYDFDFTFNQSGFYEYQCDPHVGVGMVGTITVLDPNAPDYPVYDIATVTTVDANGVVDSFETTCTLTGIVYGNNLRPGGLQFTLIDANGDGIHVFQNSFNNECYDPKEGDELFVSGSIGQFNGLTQLNLEQVPVLSSEGNALLDPILLDGPMDESHESQLLRVELISINSVSATGSSGWNLEASNANGSYLVRLDSDIFDESFAMGLNQKVLNVVGLGGQFDSSSPFDEGYQIIPRYTEDIEVVNSVQFLARDAFRMAPNPAVDMVTLSGDLDMRSVTVISADGREMPGFAIKLGPEDRIFSTAHLSPGLYIVRITTGDGIWTGRLVKL